MFQSGRLRVLRQHKNGDHVVRVGAGQGLACPPFTCVGFISILVAMGTCRKRETMKSQQPAQPWNQVISVPQFSVLFLNNFLTLDKELNLPVPHSTHRALSSLYFQNMSLLCLQPSTAPNAVGMKVQLLSWPLLHDFSLHSLICSNTT